MLEFKKIYSKSVCQWGCSKLQFLIYITKFNHIFIWILNILRWVKMADILQLTFWNCVFLNKNCFYLDPNFAKLFFWGSNKQLLSIGLCNDLVPNRQQAIIWTRYDQGLGKMILRTAFILHIVIILILIFMKSTPNHFHDFLTLLILGGMIYFMALFLIKIDILLSCGKVLPPSTGFQLHHTRHSYRQLPLQSIRHFLKSQPKWISVPSE